MFGCYASIIPECMHCEALAHVCAQSGLVRASKSNAASNYMDCNEHSKQLVGTASMFSQATTNSMERVETTMHLAKTLYQGRRFKEALAIIDQAVARFPADVELLHLRALTLLANNNTPASVPRKDTSNVVVKHQDVLDITRTEIYQAMAFATFMSVLNINANHVESLCCVGAMYKSRGMLQEALSSYQRALDIAPECQDAAVAVAALFTDMGSRAKASGCIQESQAHYQRATELCPTYAPAYYHMGVLYSEANMRQLDVALHWYQQAVRYCPSYAEAHCNIGVIHKERNDLEAAIISYEKALESSPNFTLVKNNLAIALTDLGTRVKLSGRPAEGIALYERALAYNPKYADALYNLGVAHGEQGNLDKAIFMYETAVQYNPACAEAHNNLGVIYKERDNLERAMECYTAALTVKPNFPQSLNNLGVIFTCQGRAQEALTLLTAAIAACPTYAEAYNNLGVLQRDVGAIPQALVSYARCMELAPDSRNAGQNRLLALNYIYDGDEPQVCKAHEEWGTRFASLFTPLPPLRKADRDLSTTRPLRVGYISPDLFTHSVSYFAEAPLTHHTTPGCVADAEGRKADGWDRYDSPMTHALTGVTSVHQSDSSSHSSDNNNSSDDTPSTTSEGLSVDNESNVGKSDISHVRPGQSSLGLPPQLIQHYVYCCTPKRDGKTARLRRSVEAVHGIWREVTHLPEQDLAKLIREDEIDILVELTGHTANNRLGAMAMRPAPIQVTWIGYPNSTGLQEVDYRITDELCDPLDTEQTFVEELIRLPGSTFLCYSPAVDAPPVSPAPALAAGYITFGSFNNLAKVTPQVLALWARILREVPNSRLVLKNKPFACDTARMHVLNLLAAEGVESWRVDLLPLAAANTDHLATYSLMDISLDTFPYAGTTTTCESLFMGVPCLTLKGKGHAHNVGVSLVTSVGLEEDWVAGTADEYVSLAVRHASDIPKLSQLRQELRHRMLSSRLCDATTFMHNLEGVYHDMWVKYVNKLQSSDDDAALQQEDSTACDVDLEALQRTAHDVPGSRTTGNDSCVAMMDSEGKHQTMTVEQQIGSKRRSVEDDDHLTTCKQCQHAAGDVLLTACGGKAEDGDTAGAGHVPSTTSGIPSIKQVKPNDVLNVQGSRPDSPGTPGLLDAVAQGAVPTSPTASH